MLPTVFRSTAVCQVTTTAATALSTTFVNTGYLFAKYKGTTFSFNICCTATTDKAASAVISVNSSIFLLYLIHTPTAATRAAIAATTAATRAFQSGLTGGVGSGVGPLGPDGLSIGPVGPDGPGAGSGF
jgi:hypothetical protein